MIGTNTRLISKRLSAITMKLLSRRLSHNLHKYQYSLSNKHLTTEQRDFYEKSGFLLVKSLLPRELLEKFKHRFQVICRGKVKVPGVVITKDQTIMKKLNNNNNGQSANQDERVVSKIQDLMFDEILSQHSCFPSLLDVVESMIGGNIVALHSMLINKPPDSGVLSSRHPMHQDLHYFPVRPGNGIVCAWTAIENCTRSNGCLQVVPSSHVNPGELLPHDYPIWDGVVNKAYHGIVDFSPEKYSRVHLEMEPGDTVFFHPLLIHGSGANRTEGFRKAISCHFAASECQYIDVRGTTQESLGEEVVAMAKKHYRLDDSTQLTFTDIWKLRRRLVRGALANL